MKYLFIKSYWEPGLYEVFFSPINDPELRFSVKILSDLSKPVGQTNNYGDHFEPDNYLLQLFSVDTKKKLYAKIKEIRNANTSVVVPVNNSSLGSFQVPVELNEQMSPKDMEPYLKYDVFIDIDFFLSEIINEKEASNILETFKIINDAGYRPDRVLFWYKTDSKKQAVVFENWIDFLFPSQIMEIISQSKKK